MSLDLLRRAWRPMLARHQDLQARRMRRARLRFYGRLIDTGDLVFDVGANIGERSEVFLALGATVLAVEPQLECAAELRRRWDGNPRFGLFEGACAERDGESELFVATASTISSMAPGWIETVSREGVFGEHRWHERRMVKTTTLDALIAEHGVPRFVKIDVEGFEPSVVAGLSQPVACLSLEWHYASIELALRCVQTLEDIGMSEFNLSFGESMHWHLERWVGHSEIKAMLQSMQAPSWGDVYARVPPGA